jgi:inhibitor of KinA sporulation pathway (predicted exonuclease)
LGKKRYSDNCIIVVDVESTCDENDPITGRPKELFISEIIEIGYAILDYGTNEIKENGSLVIRPEESVVTPFCSNLTGWTQAAVDRGISFQEACKTLGSDLKAGSRVWSSFGNYDLEMFKKMCQRRQVKYPYTPQHLNIKPMAAMFTGEMGGLGRTLSLLGLQFQGRQHSGKDDAFNAARILQYLSKKYRGIPCLDYLK